MVDTAAWLCDAVLPEVPVRQWVLSLPYRVRVLCAYDAAACALVRGVLVRAVSGFYERTAAREGVPRPRAGAVAFVQRFDSALRLNVHFHVLWLDGVYGWEPGRGQPEFHAQPEVSDADVQQLVQRIHDRVLRGLRKAGKWVDADAAADGGDVAGVELLPGLAAAAVDGRAALGERAGQRDGRIGHDGRWEPLVKGPLCASIDGFSLHAGAWVSACDREKLERLCRYAARPAVAESRLVELSDGRIGYALKKRWRDGTTAVVMTKAVLMERLCALVPKPRKHLVTYHGVLAPASSLRPKVVPKQLEEEGEAGGCRHGGAGGEAGAESAAGVVAAGGDGVENVAVAAFLRQQAERRVRARLRVPHGGGRRRGGRRRCSWAQLLQRALPSQFSSGLLRRPGRQRTRRRAAHVRDRGAGVPEVLRGPASAGGDPRPGVDRAGAGCDGAVVGGS